jgi:class 3 adenylate cyclase/predicted Ser/Thr protein kinase
VELGKGDRIGPYEIMGVRGRGGMGVVFEARHTGLDRITALKVLHPDLCQEEEFVSRFTQEARLAGQLNHPNLASVYDFGEHEGRLFIAMEFAQGLPLNALLSEPLPLELATSILHQVGRALAVAHDSGVVHRDLKPGNILVDERGRAVLTDFGIARSVRGEGMTLAGTLVGTPEYMSPEQATGQTADHRTDIYALGIILYECCAGKPPFKADSPVATALMHVENTVPPVSEENPELPEWVDAVIAKCCAKDPENRYQTIEALLVDLPGETEEPIPVYPEVLQRAGVADYGSTLTGIIRGELSLHDAAEANQEWEKAIRETLSREVAVASLDVVGSRRMKAPGSTVLLSYLFERLRRFIDHTCDEHGCIAKSWSGDGLVAVFEDAAGAVAAMQKVVEGLPEFETPDPSEPFRVRVGIHHGRVLMADATQLGRVTSRVFDSAGHLQKACPANEIWVSEEALQAAGIQGQLEPIGRVEDVYVYGWRPVMPTPTPGRPAAKPRSATPKPGAAPAPRRTPTWQYVVLALLGVLIVGGGILFLATAPGDDGSAGGASVADDDLATSASPTPPTPGAPTGVPSEGAVAGTVVDAAGVPVSGARVVGWDGSALVAAQSDEAGEFSLLGLPQGPRVVSATKQGYATAHSLVQVGESGASATLTFAAYVESPSGPPSLRVERALAGPGATVEVVLRAGRLDSLYVIEYSPTGERLLEVATNGVVRATVRPRTQGECRFRAITAAGTAITDPIAQGESAPVRVHVTATTGDDATVRAVVVDPATGAPVDGYDASGAWVLDSPGRYAVGMQCIQGRGSKPVSATLAVQPASGPPIERQISGLWPRYNREGQVMASEDKALRDVGLLVIGSSGEVNFGSPSGASFEGVSWGQ